MPFIEETMDCWKRDIFSKFVNYGFFTEKEAEFQINKVGKGYEVIFTKKVYEAIKKIADEKKKKHLSKFLGLRASVIPQQVGQYCISAPGGAEDISAIQFALAAGFFEMCLEKYNSSKKKRIKKESDASRQKKFVRSELRKMIKMQNGILGIRKDKVSHIKGIGFRAEVSLFYKSGEKDPYPMDITSGTAEEVIGKLWEYVKYHSE